MRKKKIKILHVAQAAGGVDRYIRMLLKYLDAATFLLGKLKSSGAYQTFMNQTIGALHPVNLNKEKKRWKLILGDDILVDSYLRVLSVACIVGIFNITDIFDF